jgi:hypothetical protein
MLDPKRQRSRSANSISSRRANSRTAVRAEIFLRQSNVKLFRATLSDISISGFKLDSYTNLDENKLVFITLPGLQTLGAHIKWVDYQDYGCEFTNPLHPAVLEHLVSKLQEFGTAN